MKPEYQAPRFEMVYEIKGLNLENVIAKFPKVASEGSCSCSCECNCICQCSCQCSGVTDLSAIRTNPIEKMVER